MAESGTFATNNTEKPLDTRTRDAIASGLIDILRPCVTEIDDRVKSVRESQVELRQQIDAIGDDVGLGTLMNKKNQREIRTLTEAEETEAKKGLIVDLRHISDNQPSSVDLEPYVKKLNNARRRVMLVNNIVQNVQERLNKLHYSVSKETARRKALLDPISPGPPK